MDSKRIPARRTTLGGGLGIFVTDDPELEDLCHSEWGDTPQFYLVCGEMIPNIPKGWRMIPPIGSQLTLFDLLQREVEVREVFRKETR